MAGHTIARSRRAQQPAPWQAALRHAWRDPLALLAELGLDAEQVALDPAAARDFPFRVTREYAARMRRGDPHDPLLRQVLPGAAERVEVPGFGDDPVGEHDRAQGSLIQKYTGRVLLLVSGACAVHCRYCFRREFPYAGAVGRQPLEQALAVLAASPDIVEAILSGGDPLSVDDATLENLVARLAALPHLRRLRVHTRLPVVLPSRVTAGLLAALTGTRLPCVLVLHVNHAQEIDAELAAAIADLRGAGITVLNQAVLLAGVNDDADTLAALSEALFAAGALPYYLNVLDRVRGAGHFAVSDERAAALERALRGRLPGYLMPRFVREVADAPAKLPLVETMNGAGNGTVGSDRTAE